MPKSRKGANTALYLDVWISLTFCIELKVNFLANALPHSVSYSLMSSCVPQACLSNSSELIVSEMFLRMHHRYADICIIWYDVLFHCLITVCDLKWFRKVQSQNTCAKALIVCTSMHIEKTRLILKIIFEVTHATEKFLQGLMGPTISEGSFKSAKLYTILLP